MGCLIELQCPPPKVLRNPSAHDIEHFVKATFPAPIYQSGVEYLEIDACGPQFKAMREGKLDLQALSKGHYPGARMNSNILPGLANVGFWNSRGTQDWGLDFHRNEGIELVLLETGGMSFTVDGKNHSLLAGNLTITRPWQLHKLGDPHIGRGKLYWLILDVGVRRPNQEWTWPSWVILTPRDLAELTRKLRHGEQSVWTANARMREVFHDLADCVTRWKEPGVVSRLTVAVNRLLVELLDTLTDQQTEESPGLVTRRRTVELFLKDLAENPASCAEPWTLESMARQCGMGITAMSKYCRELLNNGPIAHLNLCRLEHAARALKDKPESSVTEIAMAAGFNSSQYFATVFQRQFHVSPTRWRCGH